MVWVLFFLAPLSAFAVQLPQVPVWRRLNYSFGVTDCVRFDPASDSIFVGSQSPPYFVRYAVGSGEFTSAPIGMFNALAHDVFSVPSGDLWVGGGFSGRFCVFNASNKLTVSSPTYPIANMNNQVNGMASDGAGGGFLGGFFTQPHNKIMHVAPNYTTSSLGAGLSGGVVYAIHYDATTDTVFAGGSFTGKFAFYANSVWSSLNYQGSWVYSLDTGPSPRSLAIGGRRLNGTYMTWYDMDTGATNNVDALAGSVLQTIALDGTTTVAVGDFSLWVALLSDPSGNVTISRYIGPPYPNANITERARSVVLAGEQLFVGTIANVFQLNLTTADPVVAADNQVVVLQGDIIVSSTLSVGVNSSLTVQGTLSLLPQSTTTVSNTQITVSGHANLGGSLVVSVDAPGNVTVLTAGAISGTFDHVTAQLPGLLSCQAGAAHLQPYAAGTLSVSVSVVDSCSEGASALSVGALAGIIVGALCFIALVVFVPLGVSSHREKKNVNSALISAKG